MRVTYLAFWLLLAATLAVYLAMIAWTLPRIAAAAGGLAAFDLRPAGYSFEEARAFLVALPPADVAFYLAVQHRLDLVYPALLAVMLFWAIHALSPEAWGIWRWPLALLAVPGSLFDYLENASVAQMLKSGPDALTTAMVGRASTFTVLKSLFDTLAMTVALVLLLAWLWRRRAPRVAG